MSILVTKIALVRHKQLNNCIKHHPGVQIAHEVAKASTLPPQNTYLLVLLATLQKCILICSLTRCN